jgi:hypothetical protein
MLRSGQQRHAPVATGGDEVEISRTVIAMKSVGHRRGLTGEVTVSMGRMNTRGRVRGAQPFDFAQGRLFQRTESWGSLS